MYALLDVCHYDDLFASMIFHKVRAGQRSARSQFIERVVENGDYSMHIVCVLNYPKVSKNALNSEQNVK